MIAITSVLYPRRSLVSLVSENPLSVPAATTAPILQANRQHSGLAFVIPDRHLSKAVGSRHPSLHRASSHTQVRTVRRIWLAPAQVNFRPAQNDIVGRKAPLTTLPGSGPVTLYPIEFVFAASSKRTSCRCVWRSFSGCISEKHVVGGRPPLSMLHRYPATTGRRSR